MKVILGITFLLTFASIGAFSDDEDVYEISGDPPRIVTSGHDVGAPPGSPVDVKVTMYILDITSVDDYKNEFTMQFYFRQKWNDPRLHSTNPLPEEIHFNPLSDIRRIWTPDTFFTEEKEGRLHTVTMPNAFMKLFPNKDILYSIRLSMTFRCRMDLRDYPFDYQKCKFRIESYGSKVDAIKYSWEKANYVSVAVSDHIDMPDFEFVSFEYGTGDVSLNSGNYSALNVELTFKRKVGFFVSKIYAPFIILVFVSWLSFWIKPKLASLRLTLVLTTLFIMLMLAFDIKDSVPPVSYIKAIDVWIGVCLSFAFGTLLQSIFVSQRAKGRKEVANDPTLIPTEYERLKSDSKSGSFDSENAFSAAQVVANSLSKDRLWSKRADVVARILFPVLFGIFNVTYWLVYTPRE